MSVDTATCADCLAEVDDPADRRYRLPVHELHQLRAPLHDHPARSRTTGPPRPWPASRCARRAGPSTTTPPTAASTPSRTPARTAGRGCLARRERVPGADGDDALTLPSPLLASGAIVGGEGARRLPPGRATPTTPTRVAELRRRKQRDDKPFAVMVPDVAAAGALCELDDRPSGAARDRRAGRSCSSPAPRRRRVRRRRSPPDLPELGRHAAVYAAPSSAGAAASGAPLVMTSGNRQRRADRARRRRRRRRGSARWSTPSSPTTAPSTSAATTRWCGRRRAGCRCCAARAGYAPEPLRAARSPPAAGAGRRRRAQEHRSRSPASDDVIASHHIGDLEHLAAYQSFRPGARATCASCYGVSAGGRGARPAPRVPVDQAARVDLDLPIGRGAAPPRPRRRRAWSSTARTDPVVGVAFDGLGYGPDGTLWGGEVLVADLDAFERVGHLRPVADARRRGGDPRAVAHGGGLGASSRPATPRRSRRRPGPRPPTCATSPARPVDPDHDQRGPAVRRGRGAPRRAHVGELRGPGRHRAGVVGAAGGTG